MCTWRTLQAICARSILSIVIESIIFTLYYNITSNNDQCDIVIVFFFCTENTDGCRLNHVHVHLLKTI